MAFNGYDDSQSPSDGTEIDADSGEVRYSSPAKPAARPVLEIIQWAEKRTRRNFPVQGKQASCISKMFNAQYTEKQIKECWENLEKDKYWSEKGFDFGVVMSQISKVKKSSIRSKYEHL